MLAPKRKTPPFCGCFSFFVASESTESTLRRFASVTALAGTFGVISAFAGSGGGAHVDCQKYECGELQERANAQAGVVQAVTALSTLIATLLVLLCAKCAFASESSRSCARLMCFCQGCGLCFSVLGCMALLALNCDWMASGENLEVRLDARFAGQAAIVQRSTNQPTWYLCAGNAECGLCEPGPKEVWPKGAYPKGFPAEFRRCPDPCERNVTAEAEAECAANLLEDCEAFKGGSVWRLLVTIALSLAGLVLSWKLLGAPELLPGGQAAQSVPMGMPSASFVVAGQSTEPDFRPIAPVRAQPAEIAALPVARATAI